MTGGIAVVGAVPPEAEVNASRAQTALLEALDARGIPAWPVVLADDQAVAHAIEHADVVVLIDSRPVHAELARVTRLATARRLALIPSGYAFCEIAMRTCDRCPLAKSCPSSDRVAVHRALAARADLIVYASDVQRTASEQFLGVRSVTKIIPPPGIPTLPSAPISTDAIAFVGGDPMEWQALFAWATANPQRSLVIHAPLRDGATPANVQIAPPLNSRTQLQAIAAARTLVILPGHPLPYGIAAAAAYRAGKEVIANERVGVAAHATDAAVLDRELAAAANAHVDALVALAAQPVSSHARPLELGSVLLYVHHIGLGDSINFLAVASSLTDAGAHVTFAVPAGHHPLLADQLASVVSAQDLDLATARRAHDLIIEVTIQPSDAFAGDIVEDRWIQLALERQPSAMSPMHEQFLALFARAGHALVPRRPTIELTPAELAAGRDVLAGIALDRELVVAIHPGAGNPNKWWAPARFAELIAKLRGRGARIVLVGGANETTLVDEIAALVGGVDVIRCGTSLRDVGSVLAAATIVVSNDSGLMHLASAVGTPTLGIFGPTSERLWGPTHPYAMGVRSRSADPATALAALTADEVERAFISLAGKVAAEPPLSPSSRIAVSPRLQRIANGDTVEWRGRAVVAVSGGDDPVAPVVEACRAEPTWSSLVESIDRDLVTALLAAELIVPVWSLRVSG
ncbi:MAG TPA: glycosyltransferase family 9 protein [Kofleriaceae bacterium]|jgi:hypothetical protein